MGKALAVSPRGVGVGGQQAHTRTHIGYGVCGGCKLDDNLQESVLCFYYVGSGY